MVEGVAWMWSQNKQKMSGEKGKQKKRVYLRSSIKPFFIYVWTLQLHEWLDLSPTTTTIYFPNWIGFLPISTDPVPTKLGDFECFSVFLMWSYPGKREENRPHLEQHLYVKCVFFFTVDSQLCCWCQCQLSHSTTQARQDCGWQTGHLLGLRWHRIYWSGSAWPLGELSHGFIFVLGSFALKHLVLTLKVIV